MLLVVFPGWWVLVLPVLLLAGVLWKAWQSLESLAIISSLTQAPLHLAAGLFCVLLARG
jgi:hypothetical protein